MEEEIPTPEPEDDKDVVKPAGFGGFPRIVTREGEPEGPRPRGRPKGSKNKPKEGAVSAPLARETDLRKSLQDTFVLIGVGVTTVNKYDGQVIIAKAPGLAKSLDHLARENPAVKRALESALTASAWGAVITAAAGMAIPVAANHGMVPPYTAALFGCPLPDFVGPHE